MKPSDYLLLAKHDQDNEDLHLSSENRPGPGRNNTKACFYVAVLIILILSSSSATFIISSRFSDTSKTSGCSEPRIRREWRSLYSDEKAEYIRAVKCLETTTSTVGNRGSLYDDFVYVHMKVGKLSHDSASFLPWHRAFLHVYEQTLIQKCAFKGVIPYWAWDLDWYDLQDSSIFDPVQGFGGDGDIHGPQSPGDGHCLANGPFNGSQRVYFDEDVNPHCLGRGFQRKDTATGGTLQGEWFSPEKMGELRRAADFESLRLLIESDLHNGLHWTIGGDFGSWTAANDPLFFLHHGQLDRLWWMWQHENLESRLTDYGGVSFNSTAGRGKQGTLQDELSFLGLWQNTITVSEVMSTESDLICYKYS